MVTQQNLHEIPAFIDLGNNLGVTLIWLRVLLPQPGLIPGLNYHVVPPYMHPDFERLHRSAVAVTSHEGQASVQGGSASGAPKTKWQFIN